MNTKHVYLVVIGFLLVMPAAARGQGGLDSAFSQEEIGTWEFNASVYQYIVPEDPNFFMAIVTADQEMTHLEARYNYEALKSVSLHYGPNFGIAGDVKFDITPMIGFYFGKSAGAAFSYRFTLGYRRIGLYSEGEYVIDSDIAVKNFFYNWSELSYRVTELVRAGAVIQRTRIYETGLDIQRGLLAGVATGPLEATVYAFNMGWTKPTWVFSLAYGF